MTASKVDPNAAEAPPHVAADGRGGVPIGSDKDSVATAGGGGTAGFTLGGTIWDVVAGQPQFLSDSQHFLDQIEESPALRSAALLRSMERLRQELDRIPESASLDDPVTLTVRDALLISRRLLSPLR